MAKLGYKFKPCKNTASSTPPYYTRYNADKIGSICIIKYTRDESIPAFVNIDDLYNTILRLEYYYQVLLGPENIFEQKLSVIPQKIFMLARIKRSKLSECVNDIIYGMCVAISLRCNHSITKDNVIPIIIGYCTDEVVVYLAVDGYHTTSLYYTEIISKEVTDSLKFPDSCTIITEIYYPGSMISVLYSKNQQNDFITHLLTGSDFYEDEPSAIFEYSPDIFRKSLIYNITESSHIIQNDVRTAIPNLSSILCVLSDNLKQIKSNCILHVLDYSDRDYRSSNSYNSLSNLVDIISALQADYPNFWEDIANLYLRSCVFDDDDAVNIKSICLERKSLDLGSGFRLIMQKIRHYHRKHNILQSYKECVRLYTDFAKPHGFAKDNSICFWDAISNLMTINRPINQKIFRQQIKNFRKVVGTTANFGDNLVIKCHNCIKVITSYELTTSTIHMEDHLGKIKTVSVRKFITEYIKPYILYKSIEINPHEGEIVERNVLNLWMVNKEILPSNDDDIENLASVYKSYMDLYPPKNREYLSNLRSQYMDGTLEDNRFVTVITASKEICSYLQVIESNIAARLLGPYNFVICDNVCDLLSKTYDRVSLAAGLIIVKDITINGALQLEKLQKFISRAQKNIGQFNVPNITKVLGFVNTNAQIPKSQYIRKLNIKFQIRDSLIDTLTSDSVISGVADLLRRRGEKLISPLEEFLSMCKFDISGKGVSAKIMLATYNEWLRDNYPNEEIENNIKKFGIQLSNIPNLKRVSYGGMNYYMI